MQSSIWPSIMAKSQSELSSQLSKAITISKVVHLDVVDGRFAPNKILQFPFRLKRNLEYSAHLMINKPLPFIRKNKRRIQLFFPHFEVFNNPDSYLKFCQKEKIVVAMAVLPKTTFTKLKTIISGLDYVLILTVKPGFYGSKFQKSQLKKIKQVKDYIKKNKFQTKIIIDGSMNPEHLKLCKSAGADIFISGSYLMKAENSKKAMKELLKTFKSK
ncbi:hypothetical protein CL619_01175 [archaeon]|nr:hypothetical protein [archaeon]|tara:strand:+ start:5960 stop:6604 length:645 start_codon:yes stop_codon:yes gene_type:complete